MYRKNTLFIILISIFIACEKVIDLDLNYSDDRLVIEGYLNWIKENGQTEQLIKLSKTTPFFQNLRIPANGAQVHIRDEDDKIYKFMEMENSGIYNPLDTIPFNLGSEFTLEILFEDQVYSGTEVLNPVASIYKIKQDSIAFFGNINTQIEAYSIDVEEEEDNYSYFEFTSDRFSPEYNVYRDDFSNGSEYYGVLLNSSLEKNDSVRIRQYSLSKTAYQFWYLLISQNTEQGGPFQTIDSNLNGNIVNLSFPENSPLGYFRVSEVSEILYTVK